jgi:hypothetical protein
MVRGVGDATSFLWTRLGNKMNADGEQDSSVYKVIPWDTVENIKMNNAFLVKAEKILGHVKFCISQVF